MTRKQRMMGALIAVLLGLATPALATVNSVASPRAAPNGTVCYGVMSAGTWTNEILNGTALNATATDRTIQFDLNHRFRSLLLEVEFTYNAATTVTFTMTGSTSGETYASTTSRAISGGSGVISILTDTYTTGGADADLNVVFGVAAYDSIQILLGGASAGASDTVIVRACAVP